VVVDVVGPDVEVVDDAVVVVAAEPPPLEHAPNSESPIAQTRPVRAIPTSSIRHTNSPILAYFR
jgi:hypothetical protein